MAIVANSNNTYNTVGIREELQDIISMITPTDVTFQKLAGTGSLDNTYWTWQTDQLASAGWTATGVTAGPAQLEGEAAPTATFTPTVRLGGYAMILNNAASVTGTDQAVNQAGVGKNKMAYQLKKKKEELSRWIEAYLINQPTYNAGNSTTARTSRGLYGWLDLNASVAGAGGSALGNTVYSAGAGVTAGQGGLATPTNSASLAATNNYAPVAGTARAFTEGLLNGVLQACFYNGGTPDTVLMAPNHRQIFSTFVGNGVGSSIATRYDDATDSKVYATVSLYESDFGTLKAVPNRFIDMSGQNSKTVYVLDSDQFKVQYLRNSVIQDLAVTGDYVSKEIITEFGLQVTNPLASGTIRDLI